MLKITVKTLFGFEEILKKELEDLGYSNIEILNRAVQLQGDWKDVYVLNFKTRLAIAVLVEIKNFTIHKEDDLYKEAMKIDWTAYFDRDKTFAVKGAVFSTLFSHTMYPFLVIKDAIADVFRDKTGDRPNVNVKAPQVLFDVYIKEKKVTISLNTSGVPLFQRGYRQETGEAPMNEVLAAGLLTLSGWDKKSTLIDPMCGSGTLAIEAAMMAADIPAMVERHHYAFKNFKSFDENAWEEIYNGVNRRPKKIDFQILASDEDGVVLQKAKRNAKSASVANMITFERQDFKDLEKSSEKGTLICNPPYGERMGEEIENLYVELGDFFKQKMVGFDCWVVTSNMDAAKFIGLKPSQKLKVFNGSLECTFRKFSIFEGTKKIKKPENVTIDKIEDVQTQPEKKERKESRKFEKNTESSNRYERKTAIQKEVVIKEEKTNVNSHSKYGNYNKYNQVKDNKSETVSNSKINKKDISDKTIKDKEVKKKSTEETTKSVSNYKSKIEKYKRVRNSEN